MRFHNIRIIVMTNIKTLINAYGIHKQRRAASGPAAR